MPSLAPGPEQVEVASHPLMPPRLHFLCPPLAQGVSALANLLFVHLNCSMPASL